MSVMTTQASIPHGRPFTVADLEAMPDDGNRYELIDGMLIVSPAPIWAHQEMCAAAFVELRLACPRHLRVVIAPFALQTADDSEVQPDILVGRFADLQGAKHLTVAPLLAVETLSRSTQLHDRNTKKAFYERIGVASYWLLDPTEPGSLTVFVLRDGKYEQVAHVEGDQAYTAVEPFPVTIVPARLLDGTRP
jgi:Uma2 family endonuclease